MSKKLYTEEFLISELQRFKEENNRNPKSLDMQIKFGYPSISTFKNNFGTWNKALIKAGLEINQIKNILDGTETCDNCEELKLKNQNWYYKNNQRICYSCYMNSDYKNGNLDPESNTGFGFIGQRIIAKILGLDLKYDCNCSQGFGAPHDLYDEKYKYINVKTAILGINNFWQFDLSNKYIPDTYILLGFSSDKSDILHVWVTEPEDDLTFDAKNFKFKSSISITNSERGLSRAKSWEVNVKLFNDVYHNMSLENCSILKSD